MYWWFVYRFILEIAHNITNYPPTLLFFSFQIVLPKGFLQSLTGKGVCVKLKWGMEYHGALRACVKAIWKREWNLSALPCVGKHTKRGCECSFLLSSILTSSFPFRSPLPPHPLGILVSADSYMNFQLSSTEEWVDGVCAGKLGDVLIRCNNVLHVSESLV